MTPFLSRLSSDQQTNDLHFTDISPAGFPLPSQFAPGMTAISTYTMTIPKNIEHGAMRSKT